MNTQMRANPSVISDNLPQSLTPSETAGSNAATDLPGNLENSGDSPPTPVFNGDPSKSDSDIEEIVQNVALSAEQFRGAYSDTNEFVSKNGLLYDFPAEMYISTGDLTEDDGFNTAYANENVMILYVKPVDMPIGLSNGMDADQLRIFAAFPSANNYIISNGSEISTVSAGDMKSILSRYNTDHGQITYVNGGSGTFADVVSVLQNGIGVSDPLDVRYMAEDDKYISAVVSPHSEPTLIKEFVLLKAGGANKIIIDQIETQWQKFVAINSAAPDVNLDLIPAYNLCRDSKDLKTDFSALLNSMVSSGIISRDDGDPVFISGNSEFVYIEFANGIWMLAHNDDGQNDWKVYQVLRYEDAVLRMKELSKFNPPPYFLIKQN